MLTFLRRAVLGALVLLAWSGAVQAAAPKGSLVIIGGALRPDNAAVWERIVELAGGKGARIAVFPSAANNPEKSGRNIMNHLKRHGAEPFFVPIAVKLAGSDARRAANDPAIAKMVRAAGGAYFAGGDQGRITEALRQPDGANSLVLDALWQMYADGGVIAGSSAGAAIMSTTMFYDAKPVLATLKLGVRDGREIAPGLGFIGPDIFVDQHLLARGRFARMLPVMLKKGYKLGLGIDENTAMVLKPGAELEIVGYKGALLIDLAQAGSDPKQAAFNVSNVKISYLDRGDRFNLATRVYTPSPEKADGKLDPAKPQRTEALFYSDILANTTVVDLLENLIDNAQPQAIGLAIGDPREADAALGFEFKFSKGADSVGYVSSVAEAYSVFNIRLDVAPVTVSTPLYRQR